MLLEQSSQKNIKIGVSSCLVGESVRYNAKHKKHTYITETLANHFELMPFCPEVSIGLGVPREPIHLVSLNNEVRCVGTKSLQLDVTEQLYNIAEEKRAWHAELCGYIFKKNSPSCGIKDVKLLKNNNSSLLGVGLYAERLMKNFPMLPVIEESCLEDSDLREAFLQRVYITFYWKSFIANQPSLSQLNDFHTQYKHFFMKCEPSKLKQLESLLGSEVAEDIDESNIMSRYFTTLMQ